MIGKHAGALVLGVVKPKAIRPSACTPAAIFVTDPFTYFELPRLSFHNNQLALLLLRCRASNTLVCQQSSKPHEQPRITTGRNTEQTWSCRAETGRATTLRGRCPSQVRSPRATVETSTKQCCLEFRRSRRFTVGRARPFESCAFSLNSAFKSGKPPQLQLAPARRCSRVTPLQATAGPLEAQPVSSMVILHPSPRPQLTRRNGSLAPSHPQPKCRETLDCCGFDFELRFPDLNHGKSTDNS